MATIRDIASAAKLIEGFQAELKEAIEFQSRLKASFAEMRSLETADGSVGREDPRRQRRHWRGHARSNFVVGIARIDVSRSIASLLEQHSPHSTSRMRYESQPTAGSRCSTLLAPQMCVAGYPLSSTWPSSTSYPR